MLYLIIYYRFIIFKLFELSINHDKIGVRILFIILYWTIYKKIFITKITHVIKNAYQDIYVYLDMRCKIINRILFYIFSRILGRLKRTLMDCEHKNNIHVSLAFKHLRYFDINSYILV